MADQLTHYRYRGARASILLHDEYLRSFYETWKAAMEKGLTLPECKDPNYASMQTLLWHVFRAARGYMNWICKMLELPDPEIRPAPEPDQVEAQADAYLEHLLEQWPKRLAEVEEKRFYKPEYASVWKVNYCIDAMLEHAVMHPLKHRFQLREMMQ